MGLNVHCFIIIRNFHGLSLWRMNGGFLQVQVNDEVCRIVLIWFISDVLCFLMCIPWSYPKSLLWIVLIAEEICEWPLRKKMTNNRRDWSVTRLDMCFLVGGHCYEMRCNSERMWCAAIRAGFGLWLYWLLAYWNHFAAALNITYGQNWAVSESNLWVIESMALFLVVFYITVLWLAGKIYILTRLFCVLFTCLHKMASGKHVISFMVLDSIMFCVKSNNRLYDNTINYDFPIGYPFRHTYFTICQPGENIGLPCYLWQESCSTNLQYILVEVFVGFTMLVINRNITFC